ncbi:MAG: hypothetical protein WEB00_01060 [Dehalococcoidia bacterium]
MSRMFNWGRLKGAGWHLGTIVLASALVAFIVQTTVAMPAPSSDSGGPVRVVRVVREDSGYIFDDLDNFFGRNYQEVPGLDATLTVPAGKTYLIVARFSAESSCYYQGDQQYKFHTDYCFIRILIGGLEGHPIGDFAFDAPDRQGNATDYETHAVTRSRSLGPGTYRVRVQVDATNADLRFWLDDMHLTVEAYEQ